MRSLNKHMPGAMLCYALDVKLVYAAVSRPELFLGVSLSQTGRMTGRWGMPALFLPKIRDRQSWYKST